MCIANIQQVKSHSGTHAVVADGRTVTLGPLSGKVKNGDHIEVYADIALRKVSPVENKRITKARKNI